MSDPDKTLIPLGHFSSAHGIKGQILIKTYTQAPQDITAYSQLSDERGERHYELRVIRITPKGVIVSVKGIEDRNAAETLNGIKLCVERARLPEPDAQEWYYADLIGLDILGPDGDKIGVLTAMQNFGAGDLLELKRNGAKDTELIAFNRGTVPTIDLANGSLTLILPKTDDEN